MLGHATYLLDESWPEYREQSLEVEKKTVVLQVNGKVRSRIEVPSTFSGDEIESAALENERLKSFIGDKKIKKVIVVQQKLVNVVI